MFLLLRLLYFITLMYINIVIGMEPFRVVQFKSYRCRSLPVRRLFGGAAIR